LVYSIELKGKTRNVNTKMSKNCLKCVHFLRQVVFEYSKTGTIINMERVMSCTKLQMKIQPRNSEEKENESIYIPSKCHQGKYFKKSEEINIENIVCRDV
jgi:hypothetical protein